MNPYSVICLISGSLFLLVGVWPFGPYQLSLLIARWLCRFPPAPRPGVLEAEEQTFAICLCAYNEAAVIEDKIRDLLRLKEANDGHLDIAIYVDAATDGTADVVRSYADRIRTVISPERHGKTHGMNLLVAGTTTSIVMFTDANVRIDASAISVLKRYFADPDIGCVCSHLSYVNPDEAAVAAVGSAFWSFNEWSKSLESATGSVIGADGSLFAVRRKLHRPVPGGLIDDLHVSLRVLLQGARVVRAPELLAYEAHSTSAVDEFRRKIRISCQCMAIHFELWPDLRRMPAWNLYKYVGHRLMRWVGGYFLALAAACFAASAVLAFGSVTIAAIAAAAVAYALAVRLRVRPAILSWNVVLAFAGNAIGAWQAFRGETAITWEPTASARKGGLGSVG